MVSGKFPPEKFPPVKLPPGEFHPGKFPPRKFPPGKFPSMFLNIPTHVFKVGFLSSNKICFICFD